jgi:hypothetical protein
VPEKQPPSFMSAREKDLGYLIIARETNQNLSGILAFQYLRFDPHPARKIQVSADCVPFLKDPAAGVSFRVHRHSKAFSTQKISNTFGAADQHGCIGICRHQQQYLGIPLTIFF